MHTKLYSILFSFLLLSLASQAQKKLSTEHVGDKKIYYGAAYYPEVWDFKTLDEDIQRMKELHMNVMRIGEFSWNLMEPQEGQFEFDWLHKVIDKLHANGIDVILGTPTATPPIWMWEKYPEIARTHIDGTTTQHGKRRDANYSNPVYMEKSRIIVEKMAKEFGDKEGVIAWQTDNEFHLSYDYSAHTKKLFHQWLEEKYGSIETLNKAWHTNLWSQEYHSFDQIVLPDLKEFYHPSLKTDWMKFNSDRAITFHNMQVDLLHRFAKQPVTHDGMSGGAKTRLRKTVQDSRLYGRQQLPQF